MVLIINNHDPIRYFRSMNECIHRGNTFWHITITMRMKERKNFANVELCKQNNAAVEIIEKEMKRKIVRIIYHR